MVEHSTSLKRMAAIKCVIRTNLFQRAEINCDQQKLQRNGDHKIYKW